MNSFRPITISEPLFLEPTVINPDNIQCIKKELNGNNGLTKGCNYIYFANGPMPIQTFDPEEAIKAIQKKLKETYPGDYLVG